MCESRSNHQLLLLSRKSLATEPAAYNRLIVISSRIIIVPCQLSPARSGEVVKYLLHDANKVFSKVIVAVCILMNRDPSTLLQNNEIRRMLHLIIQAYIVIIGLAIIIIASIINTFAGSLWNDGFCCRRILIKLFLICR